MIRNLFRDVRFGLRTALKNPGITAVVVLTLGLGIGANTAIFSVVDAILLRPLPFPEPDRLVTVWADYTGRGGPLREWLSYPNFHDLRQMRDVYEEVAVWTDGNPTLTSVGEAETISAALVSEGMFSRVFDVAPILGRGFVPSDDQPEADKVVLVSYGFWMRRFGGDRNVIGATIALNDVPQTVIGVMPPRLRLPFVPDAEVWMPFRIDANRNAGSRGMATFRAFGRLAPGTTLDLARSRSNELGVRLQQEYAQANTGVGYAVFPLQADLVRDARAPLWVLLGAVGFVLLIACVNVANILLSRATARESELAVRAALGAGGARIVGQLFTESAVLAVLGGAVGIALAFFGTRALLAIAPPGIPRIDEVVVDLRVLVFAGIATAGSTFIFGLLPAVRGARADLNGALKVGGRGMGPDRGFVRSALVVGQVALALILLVGAGLMIRSLRALSAVDLGFQPAGVIAVQLNLPRTRYPEGDDTRAFFRSVESRLGALPGVVSVGSVSALPLAGNDSDTDFLIQGRPRPEPGKETTLWYRRATPGYFETMGLRLVRGRGITPSDADEAPPVVIINQTLAERQFPGQDPIGQHINVNDFDHPLWREIVGIVEDVKNFGVRSDGRNAGYFPLYQLPSGFMTLVVRVAGDAQAMIPAVRRAIGEEDPALATSNVSTMDDMVRASLGSDRFIATLLGLFAAVAFVLAAIGLYGVVSYGVSRRVREMGVRIALGAVGGDIRRLIVGRSIALAGLGIVAGIVGALFLTRTMSSLVFGVSTTDPLTFAGTALALMLVAALAAAIPAQRAVRVQPMTVLRQE